MLPLSAWPLSARQRVVGVLTDIDDTLTTDGAITSEALDALQSLRAAGFPVVLITGRPIGWCEPLMHGDAAAGRAPLPVDACVAENGAVALVRSPDALTKIYQQDAPTRTTHFARLHAVAADIVRSVPGARVSRDSAGRETDIAIDHSEFTHLPPQRIAQVVALMQAAGMHATVSSIHINGWFGEHNKLSGARWMLRTLWGRNLDDELDRWVYVGDSTNDALMFQQLAQSVGVANIARFAPQMQCLPRYVTTRERGAGFAEMVAVLLAARSSP